MKTTTKKSSTFVDLLKKHTDIDEDFINTFFSKEPETLEWINNFKKKNKIIFLDIGSNIGIYSIYAALKHKNIEIISFEPSTSNLRVLSRNISINKLQNKIKIFQIPLGNKKNKFLKMKESAFVEGRALHVFGENYNYKGEKFLSNNNSTPSRLLNSNAYAKRSLWFNSTLPAPVSSNNLIIFLFSSKYVFSLVLISSFILLSSSSNEYERYSDSFT